MMPKLRDPKTFRHRYEDAGIEIVAAIKRDFLPTMDDNDGGEILSWILQLCDRVHAHAEEQAEQTVLALQAENEELREVCNESNAVCACGCPPGDHDLYDEGECCGKDGHLCVRTSKAVRWKLEALEQTVRTLAEALKEVERITDGMAPGQDASSWATDLSAAIQPALESVLAEGRPSSGDQTEKSKA